MWWPLSQTYPKGPEAKDDDDKVNSVSQEHEHIHVGHSTVVWVDEVIEELSDGHIYLQSPAKQRPPALASGGADGRNDQILPSFHSSASLFLSRSHLLLQAQQSRLQGPPALTESIDKFLAKEGTLALFVDETTSLFSCLKHNSGLRSQGGGFVTRFNDSLSGSP